MLGGKMYKIKFLWLNIILIFGICFSVGSQPINIEWAKTYGGTSEDNIESIIKNKSGNFILIGYSRSNDGDISSPLGYEDVWILEIDSTGIIQWKKNFGGSYNDFGYSIQETPDSGY